MTTGPSAHHGADWSGSVKNKKTSMANWTARKPQTSSLRWPASSDVKAPCSLRASASSASRRVGVSASRRDYTEWMSGPLVAALEREPSLVSVELRPPRAELDTAAGMEAWIDTHHAVRGLVKDDKFVFLTDSAVGAREEHNLRHLVINLGQDVPRDHVVPFLTTTHSLDFCLDYAERAWQEGFRSLVVLGGDKSVGPPRCVAHAWELREKIRAHVPELSLGGWANPHADPATQAAFVADGHFTGEFFLTQVVSHHDAGNVERFLEALDKDRKSVV